MKTLKLFLSEHLYIHPKGVSEEPVANFEYTPHSPLQPGPYKEGQPVYSSIHGHGVVVGSSAGLTRVNYDGHHIIHASDKEFQLTGEPIKEDAPVNSAGAGAVAGIGVGPKGEPGRYPKKKFPFLSAMIIRRSMP